VAESFSDRVRRLREERGTSIAALAIEIGVSEGTIRQLESGNVKNPGFALGLRLAHHLGVDPYYLALGEGSGLGDRLTLLERRVAKLERRLRSLYGAGH
jgi:transcriptional regulator with XRE-family HTH domain